MPRKKMIGTVVSNKMKDTIVVSVERRFIHPFFHKTVKRTKKFHAHDAGNTCVPGDIVEIEECRPVSKLKTFRLSRVIKKNVFGEEILEAPKEQDISGGDEV
jgi:small subunit ribosomal protein S17